MTDLKTLLELGLTGRPGLGDGDRVDPTGDLARGRQLLRRRQNPRSVHINKIGTILQDSAPNRGCRTNDIDGKSSHIGDPLVAVRIAGDGQGS